MRINKIFFIFFLLLLFLGLLLSGLFLSSLLLCGLFPSLRLVLLLFGVYLGNNHLNKG